MRASKGVPRGYSAVGDDVEVAPRRAGRLVIKVDMLVEGTDVPPGMSYRQAARKAVAAGVSDFAAKGVRPESFLVSLGLRRRTSQAEVEELARGFRDAEDEWGPKLVGGDTNEALELVIDCAMMGFARKVVGRKGAKAGDALVVTGRFGLQSAGLRILAGGARAEKRFEKAAIESVLRPKVYLGVGVALGDYLSSAMDSSDGLARSLHTLAKTSGVGFRVESLPATEGVSGFAKANRLSFEELVLAGGEEYVIVGTLPRRLVDEASTAARKAGGELIVIGEATSDQGVALESDRTKRRIEDQGWTHLG